MEPRESLEHVVKLLESLPDVQVECQWCDDTHAHAVLKLSSLTSLALIVYNATFSNFSINMYFRGPSAPVGEPADANTIKFTLNPRIVNDGEPPSELEVFGIYMARNLKARQLISVPYADELQKLWNAVVM